MNGEKIIINIFFLNHLEEDISEVKNKLVRDKSTTMMIPSSTQFEPLSLEIVRPKRFTKFNFNFVENQNLSDHDINNRQRSVTMFAHPFKALIFGPMIAYP